MKEKEEEMRLKWDLLDLELELSICRKRKVLIESCIETYQSEIEEWTELMEEAKNNLLSLDDEIKDLEESLVDKEKK